MRPFPKFHGRLFQRPGCTVSVRRRQNLINEFKGFACRQRLDVQEDVAELTVAAALFLVFAFGCRLALDCFTIRDVDVFLFGFDAIFPFDLGQDMVEVDVAHAADDELLAFGALFDLARRVFFADPQEGVHQFSSSPFFSGTRATVCRGFGKRIGS